MLESPDHYGALYQFRESKTLGLKTEEMRFASLKEMGYFLKAYPQDVTLGKSHQEITVCCTLGFNSARMSAGSDYRGKFLIVGQFDDPRQKVFTVWEVKEHTYSKISNYRYLTCKYHKSITL